MEGEMVNQPTAKDRLIDRRSVLRTGAALAPAPRLMAGRQRRLSANSWSVPDPWERAKDSRFRVTRRKVRASSFAAHIASRLFVSIFIFALPPSYARTKTPSPEV